jgi:HlyD family secretion protein
VKTFITLLVCAALGVGGYMTYKHFRPTATNGAVTTKAIERGSILEVVSSSGKVMPKNLTYVGTDVAAGKVIEIKPGVEVNATVTKDQELLKLDDDLVQAKLRSAQEELNLTEAAKLQAEAGVEAAKSAQVFANAQLEAAEKAYELTSKRKTDSQEGRDAFNVAEKSRTAAQAGIHAMKQKMKEAEAAVVTAKARNKQAQENVSLAETALKAMTVKAPVAGTIVDMRVVKGQIITPQTSPILFVIIPDLSDLQVIAQVSETDVGKVKKDTDVTFTVDAYSTDNRFKGKVKMVAPVQTIAASPRMPFGGGDLSALFGSGSGSVTYAVTIDVSLDGADAKQLKPGMSANVDFVVKSVTNVLSAPNEALNYRPEPLDPADEKAIKEHERSGWTPMWLVRDGDKPHMIFVKGGARDSKLNRTQILEVLDGVMLKEGLQVVTEGPPAAERMGLPIRF